MNSTKEKLPRPPEWPDWFTGSNINEVGFCEAFLTSRKLAYTENTFFTPEGRLDDETVLQREIFRQVKPYVTTNMNRKINNLIDLLKIAAKTDKLIPQTDRIHLSNGTLFLDGRFVPGKDEIVRSRFPFPYIPDPEPPRLWLRFLNDLLYAEDIPTLQEFIGYCLIPSNRGQRMMIIKGRGGEGKSVVGTVLSWLFGCNMKDGSVGKISENRFARADLEHIHLMVDDDMQMEALKQTNYVKSLVTAQGKVDLERKGKQSYQGWLYARILAFSNGDLQSLYDRSDGFYRRQLILQTKERPADRVDNPYLADDLHNEIPGILMWAFEGLQRLAANDFHFTESERCRANRLTVKKDANNILIYLESADYVRFGPEYSVSSKELYEGYYRWCVANAYDPLRQRTFSDFMIANLEKYHLRYDNNLKNTTGQRVRGFRGIGIVSGYYPAVSGGWQEGESDE